MSAYLSNSDKLNIFSSLQSMLASGIPLLETLESMQVEASPRQTIVLKSLYDDIAEGNTPTQAFSKFPKLFDPTILAVMQGAEEAGTLEETLQDVVETLEQQIEFEDRVKEAFTYPIFVLLVFFGVLLMMLLFVIPRISDIFERLRVPIPGPTRLLIQTSDLLITYPIPIISGIIVIILGSWYLIRQHRRAFSRFIFSLPFISRLGRSIDLTRFFRSFSLLLSAGIPITESLELASKSISQHRLIVQIQHAQAVVASGKTLSEGLINAKKEVIPALAIRLISAGEKSGSLDKAAQQVSTMFEKEVRRNLKTMAVLLEPILILAIGLLVGGMMLSIIAPIYGLIGQIGGQ